LSAPNKVPTVGWLLLKTQAVIVGAEARVVCLVDEAIRQIQKVQGSINETSKTLDEVSNQFDTIVRVLILIRGKERI
jgi:uncharacterized protein with PhoU and TrkA domain